MTTQDIALTRTFAVPLEQVWAAWTDPDLIVQWWGPMGFTSHSATVDLREGGLFVWNMRAPEEMGGFDMYTAGRYTLVDRHRRIEFDQWLADKDGAPIDPVSAGMPADFPAVVRSALVFSTSGEGTELSTIEYDWPLGEQRDMSEAGLDQCLDKLEALFDRT